VLTVLTCHSAWLELRTRTVAIVIGLTRRGVVTLGGYTNEHEDGQQVEVEKMSAHRVHLSSRSVGGAD
jgi:hypothetical protein